MKTTYDAVNEFKGEWHGSEDKVYICDTGVITDYDQFNDLVSQMETNFGKSTAEDYFVWFALKDNKSTKELDVMDIEDKFEFCDNSGTHTITSNNILCCAETGRVVAVFYNERDLREATGLTKKLELIDGKAYQFDYKGVTSIGICNTTEKFGSKHVMFETPIMGAKTNSEFCTNIQPLTVEVK